MVRAFLGRHPLWAAPLVLAAHLPLLAAASIMWLDHGEDWFVLAWFMLNFLVPLTASLILTLIRRQAGLGAGPLWALVAAAPAHFAAHISLAAPLRQARDRGLDFRHLLHEFLEVFKLNVWTDWRMTVGLSLAAAGALLGLLIGLAVSRWKLRTGRWEHILPVEGPRGTV